MTLALTGKSRRRQSFLILAAILALMGAILAGIATCDVAPASADEEPYAAAFTITDMAGGDTTLREWELALAEFTVTLNDDLPGEGLILEMDVPDQVQVGGYQKFGLMSSLDCSISIIAFTCLSPDGAEQGTYRLRFLVRHRTAACESGPFTLTAMITHPDDPGSPRAVDTNTLSFDCTLPPLLEPEVSIEIKMFSGNPPGAVPFPTTITEPDEPPYVIHPSFTYPRTFTTTAGSTYLTVEPPGDMRVVGHTCTGLGSTQLTGNELRLTLERGEAADCAFLVIAPHIQVNACYEGPLGQLPTGARWGFRSENVTSNTPIFENRVITNEPNVPDEPGPFDLDDFIAANGQGWQWSEPVEWDPNRQSWRDWRLSYGIGTLLGVFIDPPEEVTVTPDNRCPGENEPIQLSLVVCNHSVDETGVNQPAVFQYYVDGQLYPGVDANGGNQSCFTVYREVPDLTEPILVEQVTPASWEHAPGAPMRRVVHYQDNPQANRPGESVEVQFAIGKGGVMVCYEAGIVGLATFPPLPGTGLACHVIFENERAESTTTPTPTPTSTPTETPEDPTTTPTNAPVDPTATTATPTGEPTSAPTQPVDQSTAVPTVSSSEPDAPASPGSDSDATPSTTDPSTSDGGSTPPTSEETVAGEQTPGPAITPIAPSTGDTPAIAGQPASVWAVLACFLFAASMALALAAVWKQQR